MNTVQWLFGTGVVFNSVNELLILTKWKHPIHRRKMLNQQFATQQPLDINDKILFHIHTGALSIQVWFGIVPNLALDLLLGTLFIDCFIGSIFPYKQKFVPCEIHAGAIFVLSMTLKSSNPNTLVINKPNVDVEETPITVRRSPQSYSQPHTTYRVMISTSVSGFHTVKLSINWHLLLMAWSTQYCSNRSIFIFQTFLRQGCT